MKILLAMAAATAGAIGALAMRPNCATTVASTTAAPATRLAATTLPEPLKIASFGTPAIAAAGRDVFAFKSTPAPTRGQARAPVLHADAPTTTVIVQQPDPPRAPSFNYLGAFGPQDKPILVYKGNGDVVNVPLRKP